MPLQQQRNELHIASRSSTSKMASLFSRLFCCLLTLTVSIGPQLARAQRDRIQSRADQLEILNCVGMVLSDEQMGFMGRTSDKGFSLLMGNSTVVAGGRLGKGRVIGASDDGFLIPEAHSDKNSDRVAFLKNMFQWVSQGKLSTVAFSLVQNTRTKETLQAHFKKVVQVKADVIKNTKADVIVVDGYIKGEEARKLIERVKRGTGLVILASNWYHKKHYTSAVDFYNKWGPNLVARAAGFYYRYMDIRGGKGGKANKYLAALPKKCKNK